MTPKGGATSSAVATMPGRVRRRRFPMNAVMAPARARAAAAAAKEPTVTITSASASPPRKAATTSAGNAAATSAIRPNVANAWA